jgi:hypothetical protein
MPSKNRNPAKWFEAGKSLNWHKDDSQQTRRRAALKSRRGNYLKTARALLSIANVSQDKETARKSKADSEYFFMMHRRTGR